MEETILRNLILNRPYALKVLQHIKRDYFQSIEAKQIFDYICKHIKKYQQCPTFQELRVTINALTDVSESHISGILSVLDEIGDKNSSDSFDWLIDQTEKFCKDRAIENALIKASEMIDSKNRDGIQSVILDALRISFDSSIGIDFFDEAAMEARHAKYNSESVKIPFLLDKLNLVTGGGLEPGTLSVVIAPTNTGKSQCLVALGADFVRQGKNVLYVTLEMDEERIAQRFEANFLNTQINDVKNIELAIFKGSLRDLRRKSYGELTVKWYAPSRTTVSSLESLLDELKLKKDFKPDVMIVDYLQLLRSTTVKGDSSYNIYKDVAEELIGLAKIRNICVITASQTKRDAYGKDFDLDKVANSIGIAETADFAIGLISNEDLDKNGLLTIKVLKNRFTEYRGYSFFLTKDWTRAMLKSSAVEAENSSTLENITTKNRLKNEIKLKVDQKSELSEIEKLLEW
jgi:replicative DNA helicase